MLAIYRPFLKKGIEATATTAMVSLSMNMRDKAEIMHLRGQLFTLMPSVANG